MLNRRQILRWFVALVLLLPLGGCWDAMPIDHQGVALMLGVSPGARPGEERWRFLFPNVTLTPGSLSSVSHGEEYYTLTVTAPSFADAIVRAQEKSNRVLYMGQLEAFLWDASLPYSQLSPLFDAVNGAGTIPKTFWVMATPRGQVASVMEFVSPQVSAPRVSLPTYFDCLHCQPIRLGVRGWKFWADSVSSGVSPTVPLVTLRHGALAVRSLLVYHGAGQPVFYTAQEAQGVGLLEGKSQRLAFNVHWAGHLVSLARIHGTRSVHVYTAPHDLIVRETLHLTGFIDEVSGMQTVTRGDELSIEHAAERKMLQKCLAAIAHANATQTDPFGYGRQAQWFSPQSGPLRIHAALRCHLVLKGEGVIR